MRCNNCGKELIGNETTCPSCGISVIPTTQIDQTSYNQTQQT